MKKNLAGLVLISSLGCEADGVLEPAISEPVNPEMEECAPAEVYTAPTSESDAEYPEVLAILGTCGDALQLKSFYSGKAINLPDNDPFQYMCVKIISADQN